MKRPAIPVRVRRDILFEAGYRCAVDSCRHATVEIHHIRPWSEHPHHDSANLIALCPNCHALADRGIIQRTTLWQLKASLASSQIHSVVRIHFDAAAPFDEVWGPGTLTPDDRTALILEIRARGMLGGVLAEPDWPLVRCTSCEALGPVDRFWTPQDESAWYPEGPMRTFCDQTCAVEYQRMMRQFLDTVDDPGDYSGEYYLQNTVEMTHTGSAVFRRRAADSRAAESGAEKPPVRRRSDIHSGVRLL